MRPHLPRSVLAVVVFFGSLATSLDSFAQTSCQGQWSRGQGVPGFDGPVYALTKWDPDGSGPLPPVVVACGDFALAGDQFAAGLATIDMGTSGIAAFPSITGRSYGPSIVTPNGDLIVSGFFGTNQNGACRIARWDAVSWTFLGSDPLYDPPDCFAVSPQGDLYASSIDPLPSTGHPFLGVARWDGAAWQPLPNSSLLSGPLLALPNGDLVAGGYHPERWDGASWHILGTGVGFDGGGISSFALAGNGDIIVVGHFNSVGGVASRGAARWNGTAWAPATQGLAVNDYGEAAATAPNGEVFAAFTRDRNIVSSAVLHWTGVAWAQIGPELNGIAHCVTVTTDGNVLVAGDIYAPSAPFARNLAVARAGNWTEWTGLGHGMVLPVRAQLVLANGDLVVGGGSGYADYVNPPGRVSRWSHGTWTGLGPDFYGVVNSLASSASGDLVAGGAYTESAGAAAPYVARWTGTTWSPISNGLTGSSVNAVLILPNGDVVAGGQFVNPSHIARWNSSQWLPLGQGVDGEIDALVRLPSGDIIAGGAFTHADNTPANRIALWNGSAWSPMGDGLNSTVYALTLLQDGSIVAGGRSLLSGPTHVSNTARWDGSAWTAFDDPQAPLLDTVRTLCLLPNGDLLAGGDPQTAQSPSMARWDGTSWSPIPGSPSAPINSIAILPSGDISVGGSFVSTGVSVSAYIARFMVPSADFDRDGTPATDADIEAFFACIAGNCCPNCGSADFNADGATATDADIESFFRVLAGGPC
jgi:hypothetical protein